MIVNIGTNKSCMNMRSRCKAEAIQHFLILLTYDTPRKPVTRVFKVYSLCGLLIHAVSFYIDGLSFTEKEEFGAKEMAQRLGTFAALTEAGIQFPAFMW